MLLSTRHRYRTGDHSRVIFALLLMSMLAVGGLLTAASDNDEVAKSFAQTIGKSAVSPKLAATSNVIPTAASKILYVGNRGDGSLSRLHTMDPDGGNVFTYTTTTITPAMPHFSPDSSKIVFIGSTSFSSGGDMVVMNADGTNEHIIDSQHETDFDYWPSWSPDGTKIVFSRYIAEQSLASIFVINADGSNAQQLTVDPTQSWAYPDLSLDGTKIAYVAVLTGLYVMNADGSNQHMIVEGSIRNPAWSPDGTKIAYENTDDFLAIVNADGSSPHVIPNVLQNSYDPSWSPDGNWIAFSGESDIFKTNLAGTSIINLTNTASSVGETQPSWGGSVPAKVVVQGEDGLPVPGAQVFHNCDLVGTTNMSGTLTLNSAVAIDDELIARAAVFTGTTQKGGHDGWAYQVWLTNILQNNDGTESPYVVTDTARMTHTLKLLPTNAQIGFNLVASVEYNTTDEHLGQIEAGFKQASEFLEDVTDGQMFFDRVKIYEDGQHFDDADFQFMSWHPRASAANRLDGSALTDPALHVYMHGPDDYGAAYNQFSAATTLVHEFGHYAIGALDEYYKWNIDDFPTSCTINQESVLYEERASVMNDDDISSEFCSTLAPTLHNDDTAQGYIHGESVWETLVDNWSSEDELWELRSPMTRQTVNKGPVPDFILCPVTLGAQVEIVTVPGAACAPLGVTADYSNGEPAVGADVFITHNGSYHDMAAVNSIGISTIVGASIGDTVTASILVGGVPVSARTTVNSCHGISLVLIPNGVPLQKEESYATATVGQWPAYWLTAVPNWSISRVDVTLHLAAASPATPTLYASQSDSNRQAVALTYNSVQHEYTGAYTFSASLAYDFQFDLELPVTEGVVSSLYKFIGEQFHTTGPNGYEKMKNLGAPHGHDPSVVPVAWGLLRPESMADVVVKPSSLPESTGVMVGKSGMPADRPSNLIAVGGPYSVQGQNPISGEIGITLEYLSEYYCGLQPGTTSIYRYTGTGWEAVPTTLIEEWHQAGGKITQWGLYGVFAQPRTQAVFSDVPAGSTFYDYINWITCHEIASGYADGTFRPSNNATRGQISKMMALTYQWLLEPPTSGYTFADVLPGSTFHLYVEAAYREGVVSGYPCGGAGEPCDGQNRPYFRPSNNVTRGQIAKIISNGSHFEDAVSGQTFEDVVQGSTFYEFVGRMASRSIINGYACGGAGEPCGVGNRPYFRPQSNATRGQLSKMIYLAAQPR